MKIRLFVCAVLAIFCVRLHAQSNTGIYVNPSNNVGIGTSTPTAKLELNGSSYITNRTVPTAGAGLEAFFSSGQAYLLSYDRTNSVYKSIAFDGSLQQFNINGAEKMRIDTSGNVGIGTTSPGTKLAVVGDAALNGPGHAYFIINGYSGDSEALWQENGANRWALGMHVGDGTENFNLYNYTTGNTVLTVSKSNGAVGINTMNPQYTLDVAGAVHAAAFVAPSQTYADFVFKPGYKLAPLSDVEAAIKKDGHLPGIPDEAEAKAHGIDLTSMQVKLLQKIEELTLHQIDQEERIEQLEKENAELHERLTK